ncbi:hypothetical protein [Pyxidicoccus xibeiensis]|uniref:hypothetical protein n=1 Tax=Pyxidicoccus xibeiensis TaxID=2906759 RepID=UPI0020A7F211|nr:hypothetical protein [Pyxidicoccus xibeiensis]MCP3144374.1 hypothetical protein [Pyxidicoccus xibeiensis]
MGCAVLCVASSGCAGTATSGVALRPDGTPGPQECSEKAREAMNYLRMFVGEAALVQIDANQSSSPIRYYEAQQVKGGNKMPLCAVARLGLGQLRKRPESKPGTAVLDSYRAGVFIVDEFR